MSSQLVTEVGYLWSIYIQKFSSATNQAVSPYTPTKSLYNIYQAHLWPHPFPNL